MKRGIVYAGMAGAAWGGVFLVPKLLPEFSPLMLSCGRYLLYGAVSLLIAVPNARRLLKMLTKNDIVTLVKLALTGNLIYYVLLASAVQLAGIATASLIVGVLPVTITFAGRQDAGAVPLSRLVWPLLMVVLGIVCINIDIFFLDSARETSFASVGLGVACAFGALLCWTKFATDNARHLKSCRFNSGDWSTLWGVTTGVLSALIWSIASALSWSKMSVALPEKRWLMFWGINLTAAVFASWFGNWMWNASSRRLPLTLGGQLIVFETLFALLYGFIYLQRLPTMMEIVAILLLIGGVCWTVQRHASSNGEVS